LSESVSAFEADVAWRQAANQSIGEELAAYDAAIHDSIGLRQLPELPKDVALKLARHLAVHRDISLNF
jgi:hypothetical protein